jgi:hypothetical protein
VDFFGTPHRHDQKSKPTGHFGAGHRENYFGDQREVYSLGKMSEIPKFHKYI